MKQLTIFNSENAEREKGFSYLCTRFNSLTVTLTPDSMKTTQATVNLVLNAQRKNKDGLCPVVLRIFWKGRKDRQTGIYVPKSQWLVKAQCVKPTHPQSGTLNMRLQELKNAVIQRRNLLVAKGLDYTIDDLLSEREVLSQSSSFASVLEDMIKVKGLSQNSAMSYRASLNRLSAYYGDGFLLHMVSADSLMGFCKHLKSEGMSDSTVNVTMACVGSVFGYAISKGIDVEHPSEKFRYWKKYRISEKHRAFDAKTMERLLGYYLRECVSVDLIDGRWGYTYVAERELRNRNSRLFALACGLMCYHLQGIAFCDLVRIKRENIRYEVVDKVEYYVFTGLKRKKTNAVIEDIYVERNDDMMPLFEYFIWTMDDREGFLLPVLGGYGYKTDKQISEAIGSVSTRVNRGLRSVFAELGIEVDGNISYYCFRHTFASVYMSRGGNPVYLASLMARNVQNIFRYVRNLDSAKERIRERNKVFK